MAGESRAMGTVEENRGKKEDTVLHIALIVGEYFR